MSRERHKPRHQKAPAHRDRIALGMAAAVASFFMLNTMNVFAKLLSPNHSVIEVAFYRNAIAAAPVLRSGSSCSGGATCSRSTAVRTPSCSAR